MHHHVVSLSGGTASARAADRVIARYGKQAVTLWFADTSWEDEDLHRFLADLEDHWGIPIHRYKDERTPLQVAEDRKIIPNQRRAPCSLELKIIPFRKFLDTMPRPLTVHLGLDLTEQHRATRPVKEYTAIPGVSVDLPLLWKPAAFPPHHREVRSWGIDPPRLYAYGFPHNNCGGRCVRQGIAEWVRLRQVFPERFDEVRDWETAQRKLGGARADYAIARNQSGNTVNPLPLAALEQQIENTPQLPLAWSNDDATACFCQP